MNMYQIVNTETGETLTGAMGYTETQRYMQTRNLNKSIYDMKIYMPIQRKTVKTETPVQDEAEPRREAMKKIIADAIETSSNSNSPYVKAEFRTAEIAAERAEQMKLIAESVEICGNPTWIKYIL